MEYNPDGVIKVQEFIFPCQDESVDITFAASVFTHLLENDCIKYLEETSRVLKDGGHAVLSIHTNSGGEYFIDLAARFSMSLVDYIDDFGGQQVCIFKRLGRAGKTRISTKWLNFLVRD